MAGRQVVVHASVNQKNGNLIGLYCHAWCRLGQVNTVTSCPCPAHAGMLIALEVPKKSHRYADGNLGRGRDDGPSLLALAAGHLSALVPPLLEGVRRGHPITGCRSEETLVPGNPSGRHRPLHGDSSNPGVLVS